MGRWRESAVRRERREESEGGEGGSRGGGGSQGAGAGSGAVRGWRRPGVGARRVHAMRNAEAGGAARKPHGGAGGNWSADRSIKLELDIQKDRMGKLIGTNGQTIKNIQQQVSAVRLDTPTKDDAASDEYKFVAVTLKGKATDVFKASKMVHDVATACLAVLTFRIGAASHPPYPRTRCAVLPAPSCPVRGRCWFQPSVARSHVMLGDRAAIR